MGKVNDKHKTQAETSYRHTFKLLFSIAPLQAQNINFESLFLICKQKEQ